MGDFEKCISLGRKTDFKKVMVDMASFIAAAYYHLGDMENMHVFWKQYLKMFKLKILRGNTLIEEEALNWARNINPFKYESKLIPFMDYMAKNLGLEIPVNSKKSGDKNVMANQFTLVNKVWEIVYDGKNGFDDGCKRFA